MQIPSTSSFMPTPETRKAQPTGFFAAPDAPETSAARKEFLDYIQKTPAELIREEVLKSMGLKEEDLKNMDPKLREAIELKIKEKIQEKVELAAEQKGQLVDIKA